MRWGLAVVAWLGVPLVAAAASPWLPDRVEVVEPPSDATTEAGSAALDAEIARALARLDATAPSPSAKVPAPLLRWPLAAQPGPGIDWHGVSNFVDLDPAFPGGVRDFNCGTRSYDTTAGYNHNGVDFFIQPYPWTTMDDGTIDVV